MYTCGPTVYNYAHIGNFRAIIAYDIVKRWLRCRGYEVTHVMNITDVDDKTIRDSHEQGKTLKEFTDIYTTAFFEDCKELRVQSPDITPRATENIDAMIALVETLIEKGHAYQGKDSSVYFRIESFPAYGKLARLDADALQTGTRVTNDEYTKDNVSDFAVWKAWSENDGAVAWDSPWGKGRPGWHLECSVMSQKYLGATIDIHMGGEDLVFPHHENEIAQSEAATGKPFVRYWLHNGYLRVNGAKMSKSAGNFYTLRDILEKGYTGREIRYLLLSVHYRQPLNFTFDGLHAARSALQRLDELREKIECIIGEENIHSDAPVPVGSFKKKIDSARSAWGEALDDDMNTSKALGVLFDTVREINRCIQKRMTVEDALYARDFLDFTDTVLDTRKAKAEKEERVPEEIMQLVEERMDARRAKDFARADTARDALQAKGYKIEDTPEGPRVKRV